MISLMSEEGHVKYKIYEFVIDTAAELSEVPKDVGVGSKVYCIEDSTVYMLNNSGEYKEVTFSSGGGSGDVESYNQLRNKPSINGVTLADNKTSEDLNILNIKEVSELPSTLVNNTIYIVASSSDTDDFYIRFNDKTHEIKGGASGIFLVDVLPTEKEDGALYILKGDDSTDPPTKDKLYFYENDDLYAVDVCEKHLYLVDELPTVKMNNSLYIVKGDDTATPPTTDKLYFYSNNSVYEVNASVIDYRDDLRLLNKPQIDEHELLGLNNTHESLELISEKDFVSAPTAKTDGMEFILPEGTPDNPIEITEINDSDETKYANNYTSSNYHINTNFDELYRLVKGKMQIVFVPTLPDPPAINTMYFVDTEIPNVYHCWLVDSVGTLKDGGTTNIDMTDYVLKTVKVGSNALDANVTTAMLNSDLKDYTTEIKNKTINVDNNTLSNIQTSNFKTDVVRTAIPLTPLDTELLTAKAIDTALKDKQDKLSVGSAITTIADDTIFSKVDLTAKEVSAIAAGNLWTYISGKMTGAISTGITSNLTASRALVSNSSGKLGVSAVTATELGYLSGVTSAIQTQLNAKQATLTGAATTIATNNLTANRALVSNSSGKVVVSNVTTTTEIGYLSGVTSAIQTQLDGKQATITGAATTITASNLTASRALVSNSSGKVGVSAVTATELGYLSGVTKSLKLVEASGTNAFGYESSTTQGFTISGDYETATPRRAWTMGGLAGLSFHCKGSAVATGAAWTQIGTIPSSYRPKYKTPVVAMIYNNGTNEAAGGHITTSGNLILWTNTKIAGNNYQVRVNVVYPVS